MTAGTILWDFDGTLVSRPRMWSAACMEALDQLTPGHPVTREDLRRGMSTRFPWHDAARSYAHLTEPDAWWAHVSTHFQQVLQGLGVRGPLHPVTDRIRADIVDASRYTVYDDVHPTLSQLAEDGWQHVIVSNHVPELPAIVQALGLAAYFKGVLSSAIVGFEKPNPRIFQRALEMTAPDLPVWMIGDNVTADCLSVRSFGIRAILVRNDTAEFAPRAPDLYAASSLIRAGIYPG